MIHWIGTVLKESVKDLTSGLIMAAMLLVVAAGAFVASYYGPAAVFAAIFVGLFVVVALMRLLKRRI